MYALLNFRFQRSCVRYPAFDIRNKQDGSKYTNHSFMSLYANVHKFKRSCQWVVIGLFRSVLFVLYVERWMWKRVNTESGFKVRYVQFKVMTAIESPLVKGKQKLIFDPNI